MMMRNICCGSGLLEWKLTLVGHAGLWVIQPYKDTGEAKDRDTSLHMHIHILLYVGVCVCGVSGGGLKCQLDGLKIVQRGGLQLHGTLGTHDSQSSSNLRQISPSFVLTDDAK